MSWSKFTFLGTVKFRVTLWFAVLFILSSFFCFLLTFVYQKRYLDARLDQTLQELASAIRIDYLAGGRGKRLGRELPLAQIPREHYNACYEKFPALRPLVAFANPSFGQIHYNLIGAANGELYLLRYDGASLYTHRINKKANLSALKKTVYDNVLNAGSQNLFYLVTAANGETIAESSNMEFFRVPLQRMEPAPFVNLETIDGTFRVITTALYDGTTVQIGHTARQIRENLEEFALLFWVVTGCILLPGVVCGWLIARRFVSGISRIGIAAKKIAAGDFSQRVALKHDGAEIDSFVSVFNAMTANTEHLLTELRDVTDNVAHDLRTPLTRIRTIAEITISGPRDLASYRDAIANIAEDCSDMISMINSMLEITRIENRFEHLEKENFSLSEQLRQAYDLYSMQAEENGQTFTLALPGNDVMLYADKLKIQRVVSNLVDNALKFTPAHGRVELALFDEKDAAVFRIADSGTGISDEDKKHIFERFFRADASRTRPGNGLGLSMVHAIVIAHDASITVTDTPGGGTTFTIRFPRPVQP